MQPACTFVRPGHKTVLHVYTAPPDTPIGVELADARAFLPENKIVRYDWSGSYALPQTYSDIRSFAQV